MKKIMESWRALARNEDTGVDASPNEEFFDELLFEKDDSISEIGIGATLAIGALGGVLGVLAIKGGKQVMKMADGILYLVGRRMKEKARERAANMDIENQEFILNAFEQSDELKNMLSRFEELTEIVQMSKGQRSEELAQQRAELKALGPAITSKLESIQHEVGGEMPHPKRPLDTKDLHRQKRAIKMREGTKLKISVKSNIAESKGDGHISAALVEAEIKKILEEEVAGFPPNVQEGVFGAIAKGAGKLAKSKAAKDLAAKGKSFVQAKLKDPKFREMLKQKATQIADDYEKKIAAKAAAEGEAPPPNLKQQAMQAALKTVKNPKYQEKVLDKMQSKAAQQGASS